MSNLLITPKMAEREAIIRFAAANIEADISASLEFDIRNNIELMWVCARVPGYEAIFIADDAARSMSLSDFNSRCIQPLIEKVKSAPPSAAPR
jgi:hypothetical protein